MIQSPANGGVGVGEHADRLWSVDDPGPDREPFETEALPVPHQRRRCRPVDFEDEAGPRAHFASLVVLAIRGPPAPAGTSWADPGLRRSNTIFTAPRRPAAAAWATASS